jgi:hypothetical protein
LDGKEEEGETATSPLKPNAMVTEETKETDANARRNMNFDAVSGNEIPENRGAMEETGVAPPLPPTYVNPRDRSKLRKTGNSNTDMATSAASFMEDRRAQ